MRISSCRVCGCKEITTFFDLGLHPFANALVRQAREEPKYPLELSWCSKCCLVQLNYTADPAKLFSQYVWVTSSSSTAKKYAETFFETVWKHGAGVQSYVLEIASNDGTFLQPFAQHGCRVLGIDPAENIAKKADSNNIPTINGFFGEALAETVVLENSRPDIVIARNVLPHVANLHDFVKGMRHLMHESTTLVIEVHYAKTIAEQLHYDSIYHEHLCYYTLHSLNKLLQAHELYLYDIMESPISGGSIVVFVRSSKQEKIPALIAFENDEEKSGINDLQTWQNFADLSFQHRNAFVELLQLEFNSNQRIVGYGASARSSTLLGFCDINNQIITAIADQNPMKQDLLTPGSHIPIAKPKDVMAIDPDIVVVLAWNFLDEIAGLLSNHYGFTKKLIVPLPNHPRMVSIGNVVDKIGKNKI